jgi:hypothetical protein
LVNVSDAACCRVFGINSASVDVFKDYFFMHGVFLYKSYVPMTPEYKAVLEFFKNSQTQKKYLFECVPFCKIGYQQKTSTT